MSDFGINLLPQSIVARNTARRRTQRIATASILVVVGLVAVITQAHFARQLTQTRLVDVREQSNRLLQKEKEIESLQARLNDWRRRADRQFELAPLLPVSQVMASVVNEMPESVIFDRLDLFRSATGRRRGARVVPTSEDLEARDLIGEVSGFARDDNAVTGFVARLERRDPLRRVSLENIQTVTVRGVSARSFRISFSIDMNVPWQVVNADTETLSGEDG